MAAHTRVGREYLRVSVDRSGRMKSTTEQHDDNVRAGETEGDFELGEAYVDVGSASRYARKGRDGFDRLVADLEARQFGAPLLVLWESSRGSRKVGEWVRLIEACEHARVTIWVTTLHREYQPSNARDRRTLLEDAVDSEYESAKTSARVTRSAAAMAAAGQPHGRVPFGYVRRYDARTGRFVEQAPDPAQRALVLELFERVAAGHSVRGIVADWTARGVEHSPGRPFTIPTVRTMLRNQAYIGVRVHAPGQRSGSPGSPGPVGRVPATWEPLVPASTWHAVQALLDDPGRRTSYRQGAGVHLLSMIGGCEPCGGVLASYTGRGRPVYRCHTRGCVTVDRDQLDAIAEEAMLDYLSRPELYGQLRAAGADDGRVVAAREATAAIREELRQLVDEVSAGRLSAAFAGAVEPGIRSRLAEAERVEAELATPPALAALMPPGADVDVRWAAAPISTRRATARLLVGVDGLLGQLRVTPCPPGRRVSAAERVLPLRSQLTLE
jgi:site-specific DNA recombinase